MRIFAPKNPNHQVISPGSGGPDRGFLARSHVVSPILGAQPALGDQAVQQLVSANAKAPEVIASACLAYDFSRIPVYGRSAEKVQPKLAVSTPGGMHEQEADRVAEAVIRTEGSDMAPGGVGFAGSGSANIQSECLGCGEKILRRLDREEDESGGRRVTNPDSAALSVNPRPVPSGLHAALGTEGSAGHSLPASIRGFFGTRFGHDFSKVRVYTDNNAAEIARALHARAFTVGNEIYFGSRQYAPGTYSGVKLLAHELVHTIQQSRGSHTIRGTLGLTAPIALSSLPRGIQRKQAVLAPSVTLENPLERLLKGEPDGLTTPFVNGVQISDTEKLDDALPSRMSYASGGAPNTCKVDPPIDIYSQAKIITASAPGKNGWTASVPFGTVSKILGVTDKNCTAKKDHISVRMVSEMGNEAYAKLVRKAEGDHEAVIKENHNKYLKPYHDLVNSKGGTNTDLRKCAEGLAKDFRAKEVEAIDNWAKDWAASVDKLDASDGPHTTSATVKVVGRCNEVLVTVKR